MKRLPWNNCRCRGVGAIWCWLDVLLVCRSRWICDRHDKRIVGDS